MTIWQPYHFLHHVALPEALRVFMLHPHSFMDRLKQYGVYDASVHVLYQGWQEPRRCEKKILRMNFRSYALTREVLIASQQYQWMYARTIFPSRTVTGELRRLKYLHNRSLGSVLFSDPVLQRSIFEISKLQPGMWWYEKVMQEINVKADVLWARRSLFNLRGKELLLTEVFLPDIEHVV